MNKMFEKSFLPIFLVLAVLSGIAFGSVAPVLFLLAPLAVFPLIMYIYFNVRDAREKVFFDTHLAPQLAETPGAMRADSNVISLSNRRSQAVADFDAEIDESKQSDQEQIANIQSRLVPQLTDQMPSDGSLIQHFTPLNHSQWIYRFHFKSAMAEFNAIGLGDEPMQAFSVAKQVLQRQIREWHEVRDRDEAYVGQDNIDLIQSLPQISMQTAPKEGQRHTPTVLIVEDDMDVATAMESIFKQLGCKTIISDGHDGASQKMSFQDVDFVVLDWVLGDNLYADQLVKKTSRIIDAFNDLKTKFKNHHVKVITYSALDPSKVKMPESEYFDHLDHWQKPVKYKELAARASDLLVANGY